MIEKIIVVLLRPHVNGHNQRTESDEVVFLIKLQNNENNHPKKGRGNNKQSNKKHKQYEKKEKMSV